MVIHMNTMKITTGSLIYKLKHILKYGITIFMVIVFFSGYIVYADEYAKTSVKIGFPIQAGTSYINENGEYAGYLVDYLNQLELFTNWDIEFVQVEGDLDTQLKTLMNMLLSGEIDMLGTMNRNSHLEELFLYPNDSYGISYTTLAVLEDDPRWIEEDFSGWNGIRIAYFDGYENQMSEFAYYATVNGFTYELVYCETYEDMIQTVKNGQADAMIQSDISMTTGFRTIWRFSPSPYYFALSHDNTQLLQQLNVAMRSLSTSQPNLQSELYDFHFTYVNEFQISEEHKDYIHSLGTLKVLFFDGDAPYQYIKNGELTGFAVEYFQKFAESTSLQYETVIANTYDEAFAMVKNGEVDLVACVATNSSLVSLDNVTFTLPYFNSFSVTACKNQEPHKHNSDLKFHINTELALANIQTEEYEAIRADYYSLSYYLRKEGVYDDIVVDWANAKNFSYTVGVTNHVPQEFITILNQYTSSMSNETKQAMMYRYSGDDVEYTVLEWILMNKTVFLFSFFVLLCLVLLMLLYAYKALLAENRLMHLTIYDTMTGAYNEHQFCKLLSECCDNKQNMALVALNIHGFKYINDTYGIKRADDVLCDIKNILESEIKEGEFFCRSSADLFFVALKEQLANNLILRTNDIFSKIIDAAAITLDGHPLMLYSGSVFIGNSPTPYGVSSNLNYMMVALAHAKKVNCHRTYIFDKSLYQAEQLRYYIETHMQSALEQEEYQLYLQPKMNLQTNHIDGAEALVRWSPMDRGMIFPDQFIPLFEENGFCMQLDLYMVEQVCKLLRTWINEGITPIAISVNQTKSLFVKEDYVDSLLSITQKYNISPQYIVLEILEGLAFENIEVLNNTIKKLNAVGFRVSMDDFGTGYSSLNTLGKLAIDELKLDRTFLMDVVNDPNGSQSEVLASILILAKKLGIRTVAEGVETKENEDMIRSLYCDYGQGYYYSRPISASDFREKFCATENLLENKNK